MMSKWTEIRDGALEAIKEGAVDVVEETKQEFLANFLELVCRLSKLTLSSSRRR